MLAVLDREEPIVDRFSDSRVLFDEVQSEHDVFHLFTREFGCLGDARVGIDEVAILIVLVDRIVVDVAFVAEDVELGIEFEHSGELARMVLEHVAALRTVLSLSTVESISLP